MPLTDPFATAQEYRARIGSKDEGADGVIDEQLAAVSRFLEEEADRTFGRDAAVVARVYDGNGSRRIWVDDIGDLTDLVVKVDLNEDYDFADADETLTIATHYWAGPANAGLGPEPKPYRHLDVVPNNGRLDSWPDRPRSLQVTAKFGWPAVPGMVKEATILIVRELRDLQKAGMTLELQAIDQQTHLSPQAFSLVQRIKREYGKQTLFV